MEKLDSPLVAGVDVVLPHALDVLPDSPDPAALLQLMEDVCVLYDGVLGAIIVFILGFALPMLLGAIAGKAVLGAIAGKELSVLSGVMVLLTFRGAERLVAGGEIGGVDHENAGAGEAEDAARLLAGREGRTVEEPAEDCALVHGSPPNMSPPVD